MPTRPNPNKNFPLGFFERRKEQESNERFAQLNKRVDAANAAKKAVADVKSFASKPKAGGAPAGRFGGQQGAMQNMAAKKAANDKSDVQMSKRMQPPKNMKAATPNITPRQSPNPSAMASSPRPPQKPMTSSPRPPKRPGFKAGGSVKKC